MVHLTNSYDYNDNRKSHVLEMCVDSKAIVKANQVDLEYARKYIEEYITNKREQTIVNISVDYVDNIDCSVKINYTYSKVEGKGENLLIMILILILASLITQIY